MNAIVSVNDRYMMVAEAAARVMLRVLESHNGTDPALVTRFILTRTETDAWMFAEIDDLRMASYQPWINALHALSTSLRGMPVFISNSSGFRYAVLLSGRAPLPREIVFPGMETGAVRLGVRRGGREVRMSWRDLGHVLVAGMTQYGKSNFLRLLTLQARAAGYRFLLGDLDGRTFGALRGDGTLMLPIASTREGFEQMAGAALEELARRTRLFDQAEGMTDNLDEYNAAAVEPLSPVLVVFDEFSSVVQGMGGPRGKFARDITELAWRGLKFGLQVVLAGQDFSKEIIGPVREQMRTRVSFRVATADISDVVIGRRGAEGLRWPGRAMTPQWTMQTYLVAREMLMSREQVAGPVMSEREMELIQRIQAEQGGRVSLEWLMAQGIPERAARRLREDWVRRGLAEHRAERNNAIFLVQAPRTSDGVHAVQSGVDGVQSGIQ